MILVTGGAGFIGSHVVDALIDNGFEVRVIDNLSYGDPNFINENAEFIKGDLRNFDDVLRAMNGVEEVWHLAANPDVRASSMKPDEVYSNNVLATWNVLRAMKERGVERVIFTSTSTVYGEAKKIPTPEEAQLNPISIYGASKVAGEAMIMAFSHTYGIKSWIFRFANVIGRRSRHGVIYDFIVKLGKNPNELEILGDGEQNKSYIYIDDCVSAMFHALKHSNENVNVFNIGSEDQIKVRRIAEIVCEELGVKPKFRFTGGERGWRGDVPVMLLSIERLKSLGWKPRYRSEEAVRKAVKDLLDESIINSQIPHSQHCS